MLTTVKNINYLFNKDNCFIKESESYKKILQILVRSFVNFHPGLLATKAR